MRFRVTPERLEALTIDQMAALEAVTFGENVRLAVLRDVLAHFVAGADGDWLPAAEARQTVGALTIGALQQVAGDFAAALKETLLPPTSDGG